MTPNALASVPSMIDRRSAYPFAFRDAAATRAVEADGVHLVEIGDRAMGVGDIADLGDGRDVAVHRI